MNNHLEVARYMVQRGGCVYSKVCMRQQGVAPESGTRFGVPAGDSFAHVSLRRRTAPPASTTQPKLGTWRWSVCC